MGDDANDKAFLDFVGYSPLKQSTAYTSEESKYRLQRYRECLSGAAQHHGKSILKIIQNPTVAIN